MTELERTPPRTSELFDVVDFDPLPQSAACKAALDYWREHRRGAILPDVDTVTAAKFGGYAQHAFRFEVLENGEREYRLVERGEALAPVVGAAMPGVLLSAATGDGFAERGVELFGLALDRGEPVSGQFGAAFAGCGELHVEILAAPLAPSGDGIPGIFGAIAYRRPGRGWEDDRAATT